MWAKPIHDVDFVKGLLSDVKRSPKGTYHTLQRITGLLTVISEVSTWHTIQQWPLVTRHGSLLGYAYAPVIVIKYLHSKKGCT